jgi:hypothetical protein
MALELTASLNAMNVISTLENINKMVLKINKSFSGDKSQPFAKQVKEASKLAKELERVNNVASKTKNATKYYEDFSRCLGTVGNSVESFNKNINNVEPYKLFQNCIGIMNSSLSSFNKSIKSSETATKNSFSKIAKETSSAGDSIKKNVEAFKSVDNAANKSKTAIQSYSKVLSKLKSEMRGFDFSKSFGKNLRNQTEQLKYTFKYGRLANQPLDYYGTDINGKNRYEDVVIENNKMLALKRQRLLMKETLEATKNDYAKYVKDMNKLSKENQKNMVLKQVNNVPLNNIISKTTSPQFIQMQNHLRGVNQEIAKMSPEFRKTQESAYRYSKQMEYIKQNTSEVVSRTETLYGVIKRLAQSNSQLSKGVTIIDPHKFAKQYTDMYRKIFQPMRSLPSGMALRIDQMVDNNTFSTLHTQIGQIVKDFNKGKISAMEMGNAMTKAFSINDMNNLSKFSKQIKMVRAEFTEMNKLLKATGMSGINYNRFKDLSNAPLGAKNKTAYRSLGIDDSTYAKMDRYIEYTRKVNNQFRNGQITAERYNSKMRAVEHTLKTLSNEDYIKLVSAIDTVDRKMKSSATTAERMQKSFLQLSRGIGAFNNVGYNKSGRTVGDNYLKTQMNKYLQDLKKMKMSTQEYKKAMTDLANSLNKSQKIKVNNEMEAQLFAQEKIYQRYAKLLESDANKISDAQKKMQRAMSQRTNGAINSFGYQGFISQQNNLRKSIAKYSEEAKKQQTVSYQVAKGLDQVGNSSKRTTSRVNKLDKASNMFRRTLSSWAVTMIGYPLIIDTLDSAINSMDASTQIRKLGGEMNWGKAQTESYISTMRQMQTKYTKIDMSQTAKSVAEMSRLYNLNNSEAKKMIETSAVFTSAMAREGRSTQDANLALKDYLDGGAGWTRRMQEIGASRENLNKILAQNPSKYKGITDINNADTMTKIQVLDDFMKSKNMDIMAQKVYTLDEAMSSLKLTMGSLIGEVLEGISPIIIGLANQLPKLMVAVRGFNTWLKGNGLGQAIVKFGAMSTAIVLLILKFKQLGMAAKIISNLKFALSFLFTNPFGLMIMGLTAVAVLVYEVGKAFGWWDSVGGMLSSIINSLGTLKGQLLAVGATILGVLAYVKISSFLGKGIFGNGLLKGFGAIKAKIIEYIGMLKIKNKAEDSASKNSEKTNNGIGVGGKGKGGKTTQMEKGKGEVSRFNKLLTSYGITFGETATASSIFSSSCAMATQMLAFAIPIITAFVVVVGIIVAEVVLLVKGIQLLINAMKFDSIDLRPATEGIKQIGQALWEMNNAFLAMNIISLQQVLFSGFRALSELMGGISAVVDDLKASISKLNEFSTAEKIKPDVVNKLSELSKGLVAMNNASKNLGDIGSQEGWKKFWEWLKVKMPDSEALAEVHGNLRDAIPKINSFDDLPAVSDQAVQKITKASEAITKLDSAMKGLEGLGKHTGGNVKFTQGGNAMPQVETIDYYAGVIDSVKDTMWRVADKLAELKDMPAIPEGTGNKIQRVTWTLNDVVQSFNALAKIPPANDGDIVGILGGWNDKISSARDVIWKVAEKLRTLHDMPAIPEGTGGKIQRVTWVLNDVKVAMDTLARVLSNVNFDGDYQSYIDSVQIMCKAIRGVSIELNQLSTIANIPETVGVKLQRIGWVLNDLKSAVNTVKTVNGMQFTGGEYVRIQTACRLVRTISVHLNQLQTIANVPPIVGQKLGFVNNAIHSLTSVVNAIRSCYNSMIAQPIDPNFFQSKLNQIEECIRKVITFANNFGGSLNGQNGQGGMANITNTVRTLVSQLNQIVGELNGLSGQMNSAGYNIGNSFKSGVSNGIAGTSAVVWAQISSMNSAMDSARGKSDQLGGAFSNLRGTVYTLTQGINNLKDAINNLPSSKQITIDITANQKTNGAGLPAGISMDSISTSWGTVTGYSGGHASTGGRGLFAGINTMDIFRGAVSNMISGTSYDFYYGSKGNSASDKSFNCVDGSLMVVSLASQLGLDSELRTTNANGTPHMYPVVNGEIFDTTAKQLFGKWRAGNVRYAGLSSEANKTANDNLVTYNNKIEININGATGDKKQIAKEVERKLKELFNNSKGTGI